MQKKCSILICDDDPADIKIFKSHFLKTNYKDYEIVAAINKNEIEQKLGENKESIVVIFLDFHMPEKTGLEWLKDFVQDNLAPVIMLTGAGDETTAVETMKLGAMDYLPKDKLNKYEIERAIKNSIERWNLMNERDSFLGIAVHEIRNPLSVIMGYVQLLSGKYEIEEDKKKEIYSIINERSNYVLEILNKLLDINSINRGKINFVKRNFDLVQFLKTITKNFQFRANQKNIVINFHSNTDNFQFDFDPFRLEEAFTNILDNAVKFSFMNSKIDVNLEKKFSELQITFQDFGQGIKPDELKYLFQLFSSLKISSKPTGGEKTLGLGLAICKKIISMHGGKISVESGEVKGSKFIIVFPITNQ